jgi:hypothetical protein
MLLSTSPSFAGRNKHERCMEVLPDVVEAVNLYDVLIQQLSIHKGEERELLREWRADDFHNHSEKELEIIAKFLINENKKLEIYGLLEFLLIEIRSPLPLIYSFRKLVLSCEENVLAPFKNSYIYDHLISKIKLRRKKIPPFQYEVRVIHEQIDYFKGRREVINENEITFCEPHNFQAENCIDEEEE